MTIYYVSHLFSVSRHRRGPLQARWRDADQPLQWYALPSCLHIYCSHPQIGSTQRSSRYVLEALPPNATLNNPKLTLNANNTPNPGVKFGSTTFSTQYSNPSGKLDPVAFDPASMVMKIPAAMNANVDIPNPTFKKVSIPLISDGGNTDSKSLSSGHI